MDSKNRYAQRTPRLGIPVPGYDQPIWPELELKKWTIVENLLLAGIRGLNNCVFYEGHVSLNKEEDGTFSVTVERASHGHSLTGIVAGKYFEASRVLKWPDLAAGRQYYLYVTATEKTFSDPTAIRPVTLLHSVSSRSRLLVAHVDLRKDDPEVNSHPDGKHYSDSMVAPPAMLSPRVVEFETVGMDGVVLSVPRKVAFVETSRVYVESSALLETGEVHIGYHGSDPKAKRPGDVVVYNTGDAGVLTRAIIFTE
jgi:hypothetical protein